MTIQAIWDAVRQMSPKDRESLKAMIDGLSSEDECGLTDAQKSELDSRMADDDAHPNEGVTFEEMVAAARARHGR